MLQLSQTELFRSTRSASSTQHAVYVQRQFHGQAGFGLFQIQSSNFTDPVQAVAERVAMDESCFRSLSQAAVVLEIDLQGPKKLRATIVCQQGTQDFLLEGYQGGIMFELEQQPVDR